MSRRAVRGDLEPVASSITMKFGQLVHGAQFEYRGARYRKISAIDAINAESGQRKLIPRSAQVVAVDAAVNVIEDRIPESVKSADLKAALATCWSNLRRRVHQDLLGDDAGRIAVFDELLMQSQGDLRADLLSRGRGHGEGLPNELTTINEGDTNK